jgi:hypothetical protein
MKIVRRPIGRNDFGEPEDTVMDVAIPIPLRASKKPRVCVTGETIDSDGTLRRDFPIQGAAQSRR